MACSRRTFIGALASAAAVPAIVSGAAPPDSAPTPEEVQARSLKGHHDIAAVPGLKMLGDEKIAMLLYPGFTALDLVGPQYFFASMIGASVTLVAKTADPVTSDTGITIAPTATFATCPAQPTLIFVPGGATGTVGAMNDAETIAFLADRGSKAQWVTSVCTGSLLLGMAGLLTGKRATSHWVTREILRDLGAIPIAARVVRDGNLITGAGVTSGIDFALAVVAALRGDPYAEALTLQAEYAPAPPFKTGTPESSRAEIREPMREMFLPVVEAARQAARQRKPATSI